MNYTYYGNAGIGFNLVQEFDTQQNMIKAFSSGYNYTDVKYGEYVIIGAKDSEHAGKIYRRGYDFQNGLGGAIYITNILSSQQANAIHIEQQLDKKFNQLTEDINLKLSDSLTGIAVGTTEPVADSIGAWINPALPEQKEILLTLSDIANSFGAEETKIINQKFFTEQIQALWDAISKISQ